jgi:hypothetical protein
MKNSKQLLFERMHSIGGMPLNENFINEMPKRKIYPIQQTKEWSDLLNTLKTKFDVTNVSFNLKTDKPFVKIEKSGYYPLPVLGIKSEWLYRKDLAKWLGDHIIKRSEENVNNFKEKPKQKRVRTLPSTASIEDKIKMWDLIREKAYNLFHSTNKHDEVFWEKMWDKYGYPWRELYDQIKDTPEFEDFRKKHNIANNLTFDDTLA